MFLYMSFFKSYILNCPQGQIRQATYSPEPRRPPPLVYTYSSPFRVSDEVLWKIPITFHFLTIFPPSFKAVRHPTLGLRIQLTQRNAQ